MYITISNVNMKDMGKYIKLNYVNRRHFCSMCLRYDPSSTGIRSFHKSEMAYVSRISRIEIDMKSGKVIPEKSTRTKNDRPYSWIEGSEFTYLRYRRVWNRCISYSFCRCLGIKRYHMFSIV